MKAVEADHRSRRRLSTLGGKGASLAVWSQQIVFVLLISDFKEGRVKPDSMASFSERVAKAQGLLHPHLNHIRG